jgi:hypothetical protein
MCALPCGQQPKGHHSYDADCKLGKNEPRAQEEQDDCCEFPNIHTAIMRLRLLQLYNNDWILFRAVLERGARRSGDVHLPLPRMPFDPIRGQTLGLNDLRLCHVPSNLFHVAVSWGVKR